MLKTCALLFYEYFKTGLFSFGGGYATLPFLFYMAQNYDWFTQEELVNIIAISNVTPGAIGLNMATYAGFMASGVAGSITATAAVIIGPFILAIIVIYFLNRFKNSKFIKNIFTGLRPASCALLSYVTLQLFFTNIIKIKDSFIFTSIDYKALILTLMLFIIYKHVKNRPNYIIFIGAILGIVFNAF